MAPKLTQTDEQHQLLEREKHSTVYFVDQGGNVTHVIFPIEEAHRMFDKYMHSELQAGFDQADRGQFVDWDPKKIKTEGRRHLKNDSRSA